MFEVQQTYPGPEFRLNSSRVTSSGTVQQHLQDGERLTFHADTHPFLAHFPGVGAELVSAEVYDARFSLD